MPFCGQCGAKLEEGMACQKCGSGVPMAQAVATPVVAQAVAVPVQAQPIAAQPVAMVAQQPMQMQMPAGTMNQWSSGMCECCSDCCTCWAGMCCSCIAVPQMWARVLDKRNMFGLVCAIFVITYCVYQFAYTQWWGKYMKLVNDLNTLYEDYGWDLRGECLKFGEQACWDNHMKTMYNLASIFGLILTILVTCFLCATRKAVRTRDGIPGDDTQDCCLSFWCCCWPCTLCQIMRHEGLGNGKYNLCSNDGGQGVARAV